MGDRDRMSLAGSYTRRGFLRGLGAAGVGSLAAPMAGRAAVGPVRGAARRAHTAAKRTSPIKTIVVSIQENHSFDHYFGTYSRLPAGSGIPKGFSQPNGHGGTVKPYHFADLTDGGYDPNHDWSSTHEAWDKGRMDGFYEAGGTGALGYYEASDLPFYYSLLPKYTLCASYHCSVLTETLPNRMCLYAGTSGGNTESAPPNGSLTWPCILDLLEEHGVTFRNYNFHCPDNHSSLALWEKWETGGPGDELNQSMAQFFDDCKNDTLPNVAFIEKQTPWDEHPPANIQKGMGMMESIVTALQKSPAWPGVAMFLTWSEGGGFFDHVAPKQLDAFGLGIRVPMLAISASAKPGHVDTTLSEHSSVLKFIEHVFGLPTLASVNHQFDKSTPAKDNQTGGAPFPPRDGNSAISDLTQCFAVAV